MILCGINMMSAFTLQEAYNQSAGFYYTNPASPLRFQFQTATFETNYLSHKLVAPISSPTGPFTNIPGVAGKSPIFTFLGASRAVLPLTPAHVQSATASINSGTQTVFYSLSGVQTPFQATEIPYWIVSPYTLDVRALVKSTQLTPILTVLWNDSAPPNWDVFDMNFAYDASFPYAKPITDLGFRHYAVTLQVAMGYNGSRNPCDLVFDIAIPVEIPPPSVPEPHVYVLIGSLLVLAYVVGRKKAKEQC